MSVKSLQGRRTSLQLFIVALISTNILSNTFLFVYLLPRLSYSSFSVIYFHKLFIT